MCTQTLLGSKAANLALKGLLPPDDLDVLKEFFVDAVGIPESLTQQDLEARLRGTIESGATTAQQLARRL